jgi:hydrogenase maturation protein HypF
MVPTIAVGGYLKAAAAWSNGVQSVLGPHIGDQETLPARERFVAHLNDWQQLYRFHPAQLVHDMHPEYFSTQWAQSQPLPTLAVQHHHAHVVAGMLEYRWLDRRVLGVAWDGTGYGTDGTIWGGEFLVSTATSFKRVGRLRPFRLPGGEAAIREPWRTAVSVCDQCDKPIDSMSWCDGKIEPDRITAIRQIADRPQLSPLTSSAGRLFDAVAALVLGVTHADFDGQPAMRLEAVADRSASGEYPFPLREGELGELDWRPLVAGLLADRRRGVDPGTLAMRFHRSLARGIADVCHHEGVRHLFVERASQAPDWPQDKKVPDPLPIVLTGGVFQNRLLTELVAEMLDGKSQSLGLPGVIPPNDGGLAAGQLAVAAAKGQFPPCA